MEHTSMEGDPGILGFEYELKEDIENAVLSYLSGFEAENIRCYVNLACMILTGKFNQNLEKWNEYIDLLYTLMSSLEKAVTAENLDAAQDIKRKISDISLIKQYVKNPQDEAWNLLKHAASIEKSGGVANYNVGVLLSTKQDIVEMNLVLAADHFLKAGNMGHSNALNNLATLLLNRDITCPNMDQEEMDKIAVQMLQEAANGRSSEALYNLGMAYHMGIGGLQKDIQRAEACFQDYKAANIVVKRKVSAVEALIPRKHSTSGGDPNVAPAASDNTNSSAMPRSSFVIGKLTRSRSQGDAILAFRRNVGPKTEKKTIALSLEAAEQESVINPTNTAGSNNGKRANPAVLFRNEESDSELEPMLVSLSKSDEIKEKETKHRKSKKNLDGSERKKKGRSKTSTISIGNKEISLSKNAEALISPRREKKK